MTSAKKLRHAFGVSLHHSSICRVLKGVRRERAARREKTCLDLSECGLDDNFARRCGLRGQGQSWWAGGGHGGLASVVYRLLMDAGGWRGNLNVSRCASVLWLPPRSRDTHKC